VHKIRCSYLAGSLNGTPTSTRTSTGPWILWVLSTGAQHRRMSNKQTHRKERKVGMDGWMSIAMQKCRCRVVGGSSTAFTPAWRLHSQFSLACFGDYKVLFRDRVSWIKLCDFSVKITRNLCMYQLGRYRMEAASSWSPVICTNNTQIIFSASYFFG